MSNHPFSTLRNMTSTMDLRYWITWTIQMVQNPYTPILALSRHTPKWAMPSDFRGFTGSHGFLGRDLLDPCIRYAIFRVLHTYISCHRIHAFRDPKLVISGHRIWTILGHRIWVILGLRNWSILGPQIGPFLDPKLVVEKGSFWDPYLGPLRDPIWDPMDLPGTHIPSPGPLDPPTGTWTPDLDPQKGPHFGTPFGTPILTPFWTHIWTPF